MNAPAPFGNGARSVPANIFEPNNVRTFNEATMAPTNIAVAPGWALSRSINLGGSVKR